MKKITIAALIAITAVLTNSGCSKDTTTTPIGNNSKTGENMTATIDGVKVSRDTCKFYFANPNDSTELQIFNWVANWPTGTDGYPFIYMFIDNYHGVGTYEFIPKKKLCTIAGRKFPWWTGCVHCRGSDKYYIHLSEHCRHVPFYNCGRNKSNLWKLCS